MDVGTLEQWLWAAASEIRGPLDAPKFKDYILPLVFLKRLSDVFDDEIIKLADEFGGEDVATKLADADHSLVRFYIPELARWPAIARMTTGLGEYLTDAVRAVARQNPRLQGVIDVQDFNETAAGQRVVDDGRLQRLVQVLGRYRLGLDDVEPDLFGRAYEYLLRKFAEGGGASAGEFYTPREVAVLMARILEPEPGMSIYDPCCGSAGLLIKCHLRLLATHGAASNGHLRLPPDLRPLELLGQEINPATYAISRMNAVIHDMEAEIALGGCRPQPRGGADDRRRPRQAVRWIGLVSPSRRPAVGTGAPAAGRWTSARTNAADAGTATARVVASSRIGRSSSSRPPPREADRAIYGRSGAGGWLASLAAPADRVLDADVTLSNRCGTAPDGEASTAPTIDTDLTDLATARRWKRLLTDPGHDSPSRCAQRRHEFTEPAGDSEVPTRRTPMRVRTSRARRGG